jgi:hypothetical protein
MKIIRSPHPSKVEPPPEVLARLGRDRPAVAALVDDGAAAAGQRRQRRRGRVLLHGAAVDLVVVDLDLFWVFGLVWCGVVWFGLGFSWLTAFAFRFVRLSHPPYLLTQIQPSLASEPSNTRQEQEQPAPPAAPAGRLMTPTASICPSYIRLSSTCCTSSRPRSTWRDVRGSGFKVDETL